MNIDYSKKKQFVNCVFLLQPLLSASVLDDYIKNPAASNNLSSEIAEPECYSYIVSLQMLSFLLSVSDYLIVLTDWSLDLHLIKLIETGIMMVGSSGRRAQLIWFHRGEEDTLCWKKMSTTLETLLGREHLKVIQDESELDYLVFSSKNGTNDESHPSSEKSWLVSAQRFWENSIKKSSLYSDYARFMP